MCDILKSDISKTTKLLTHDSKGNFGYVVDFASDQKLQNNNLKWLRPAFCIFAQKVITGLTLSLITFMEFLQECSQPLPKISHMMITTDGKSNFKMAAATIFNLVCRL